ncbi:hypothetical protein EV426DRAFT_640094 [Tirmania nivea]|nr:hypothetical protein EV426DRAFT_640094 [Tirmania nivea]
MARLAKVPNHSSLPVSSPMRGRAPPSSPPSAFQVSPMPEASQLPPFHLRARPLSKLSLNIFRLLRNHPSFHQEDENWRTRLRLYKLVQEIVESVVDAMEEEPLMFSKERRKEEDGQEAPMELGLGELKYADKVSFQSPVEDAGREYFTSGKSPTKAKLPKLRNGKSKSSALEEAISKVAHHTGGLDMGPLDSEDEGKKPLSKETSIERNTSKVSTMGRAKGQAATKTAQAVLSKSSTISETVSPGQQQQEENLQQHIAPERATRSRRGITSRVTVVPTEKQAPTSKNTRGTRANTKADLLEEGNLGPKGVMGIKRTIPLKRPIQGLPEVTSPVSQKTKAPTQVKSRKIVLGDILNEAMEITPQTRTLRSSKRLTGPKGGADEKAKGPLRSINKELQIFSEAVNGTSEEMNFDFRRPSGEAHMDSTSANGKAAEGNRNQNMFGKTDWIIL